MQVEGWVLVWNEEGAFKHRFLEKDPGGSIVGGRGDVHKFSFTVPDPDPPSEVAPENVTVTPQE
jgi:hypothetical protein